MKILSSSEAKLAWVKGEDTVEVKIKNEWVDVIKLKGMKLSEFDDISNKFRIKPKLETVEILPPKKVVLDPITGSVGFVYGDIGVAKEQMEAIVKQLNLSMNGY